MPRPGRSNATGRPDYSDTTWGRMLKDPASLSELRNPHSYLALLFRRRFRIPFQLFELLLSWTTNWWRGEMKKGDSSFYLIFFFAPYYSLLFFQVNTIALGALHLPLICICSVPSGFSDAEPVLTASKN